jgi:hypothetical protein
MDIPWKSYGNPMEIPWKSYEILTPKTAFQGFQGPSPHTAGARGRREAREPLRRRLRNAPQRYRATRGGSKVLRNSWQIQGEI